MNSQLEIAILERDRTATELVTAEKSAATSRGADQQLAELAATSLRSKLTHEIATVSRLTVDPIKRLRRGLASFGEICDAIDQVVFANDGSAVWFGLNVSAANSPDLMEALSIAINRLPRKEHDDAMTRARSRAIPHDPADRRLFW